MHKENCYPIAELCVLANIARSSYYKWFNHKDTELDKAIDDNLDARPLFHSDRSFQYTNKIFKNKLDKINAIQSMSRAGRCIDNGPMEGFWGTLKSEMYYLRKFDTYEELEQAIDEYIDFYNTKGLQKKLKSMTPIEYRSHTLVA
ncbi:IS3 family transposase [uncultured Clostridium sp.]|uniref:IS3 family transposase n=1 Tax=uncultured Clostridium sp. TaxID=59620 RepID=UPI0028E304EA|nr:IS3 family transposase [uncultured Clostridium sp.]